MYSISKETYDLMREMCGDHPEQVAGKLVPSKLTNRLMWIGGNDTDPVHDFGRDATMVPILLDCQQSMSSPASNGTVDSVTSGQTSGSWSSLSASSGSTSDQLIFAHSGADSVQQNTQNLSEIWELLRSINDDCDFCAKKLDQRKRYPKHTLYDDETGALTCPVVLASTCSVCKRIGHTRFVTFESLLS